MSSDFFQNLNDGSNKPPRLAVHQSWWAMIDLGNGEREWTVEEKFEKIAAAGFTGILGGVPSDPQEAAKWRNLLDRYNFDFGITITPRSVEEGKAALENARNFGVNYVNAQVQDNFVIGQAAIDLLQGLVTAANEAEMPFFAETHRGRITQDLHRTVDYVQAVPGLRLTLDLSHYILAGEMGSPSEKGEALFNQLLPRTGSVHARVSNGEQIQVDIGPEGQHPMVAHFKRWWSTGMRYWAGQAGPGDVFPFISELGPAGYAITLPGTTQEISDRWEQALVFKRIAEECWEQATQPELTPVNG
jgi:sugar phosphate isomerase/epimerase